MTALSLCPGNVRTNLGQNNRLAWLVEHRSRPAGARVAVPRSGDEASILSRRVFSCHGEEASTPSRRAFSYHGEEASILSRRVFSYHGEEASILSRRVLSLEAYEVFWFVHKTATQGAATTIYAALRFAVA